MHTCKSGKRKEIKDVLFKFERKKVLERLWLYAAGVLLVLSLSVTTHAEAIDDTLAESEAEGFDYSALFDVPPSDAFASGAVFDISRQNRELFLEVLQSGDASLLRQLFEEAYALFKESPEVVGYTAEMIYEEKEDTNPQQCNADFFELSEGEYAALLYMPIENDELEARIAGIIFSETEDGYYYCMLSKDEETSSEVLRNMGWSGVRTAGNVEGRGFELMDSFLECITTDFNENQ